MSYCNAALAKSSAGFDIPNYTSTNRCSLDAPFFTPEVYGRLYRGSKERRFSCFGYVNSVQSAALLFDINGGSSHNEHEATAMSNIINFTARPSESEDIYDFVLRLSASEMDAFTTLLSNLHEADLSEFTDRNTLAKKAIVKALEAISELGGVQ